MRLKNTSLWLAALSLSTTLGGDPVFAITTEQLNEIQRFIAEGDLTGLRAFLLANLDLIDDIRTVSPVVAEELRIFAESGNQPSQTTLISIQSFSADWFDAAGVLTTESSNVDLTALPPEDGLY